MAMVGPKEQHGEGALGGSGLGKTRGHNDRAHMWLLLDIICELKTVSVPFTSD